tara:strand:- start:534 stop:1526 length:993 start_codon:yes stop_codon:yes gene_type:complete
MSLISCLGLVIFLYAVGSNPLALISAGRFSWFLDPTANIFLVAISQYFIAAVMLVCALFILVGKTKLNIFIFVVVLLVVVSYSLISLDRKFIIFFVSGSFAGIYLKNNQKLNLTKKTITVSSLLFGFMILSQMARDLLARYLTIDNMSPAAYLYGFKDQVVYFIEYGDISYFYRASLESIAISLEEGILAPGALVIRNLLFFLPSSITFGIKPPDISATFSVYVNGAAGGRAGNMPPGVFGLYVASFGVYWSAMLLVSLPFCLRMLDNLVRKSRFWAFVLGSTCLSSSLFFMRGDDSTAIYFPLFIALCLGFSMLAYRLTWGSYALSKNR